MDPVKNEKVLHRVDEEKNILRKIQKREINCFVHTLRRTWFRKHVIEGKVRGRIEVTGRRGTRCKQILDDFKEERVDCLKNWLWKMVWA